MTTTHTFEKQVGASLRRIEVSHDALRDKVHVLVDGAPVATKLTRRAFSNLWRFGFQVDGTPLEIRVSAAGARGVDVLLCEASSPIAKPRMPVWVLASPLLGPLVGALVLPGPLGVRAVIGFVAGALTAAIVTVVYRRT